MIKVFIQFLKNQKGVAATEFALIAPPLLFMLIGLIDYGTYLNGITKLENTALAAAQYIRNGGDIDYLEEEFLLNGNLGLDPDTSDNATFNVVFEYECAEGEVVDQDTDCGARDYLREFVNITLVMNFEPILPYPDIVKKDLSGNVRLQTN